ncbi:metalloprotease [Chryseomicrobium excrementi]|uniref:Metalloprotease n=1 Tax=Chryseomicrobium excrementi TaxID=2041346 RepID=A0A2M9EWY6_9BACL|nr:neutral zinc metallopeptidase [Chryseomicrobium excrementi]PJK15711.1 metalloprotease [Chryseomicrobium excrementi]
MKWQGRARSSNVEDRRGMGGKGIAGIGGGLGLIIAIIFAFVSGDPGVVLDQISGGQTAAPAQTTAQEDEAAEFVSVVLADTERIWTEIFEENGLEYTEPTLVLYTGQVNSACGTAGASVGPFYCPGDYKLYIDLSFYTELSTKYDAPGDFAMAYVVAHEVGHHVQTLLGTTDKVMPLRQRLSEEEFNKYLVRFELQADYFSGVWAHHAEGLGYLEEGDIDEALAAAAAVGDDTLQKRAQGYVVEESFTHGTSEQRKSWFYKGYENGTIQGGDTFNSAP